MEKLTDIELDGIQLHETKPRSLGREASLTHLQEDDIETAVGPLHVVVQGDRSKKAMVTYHDIGQNRQHEGALPLPQGGMKTSESANLLEHAGRANNTAPINIAKRRASLGFSGDQKLMANYQYPDMDQLAEMLLPIMQFYGIRSFIGFGVGAGANILSRFALKHHEKVDGLCLINATCGKPGWTEWGFQKWNSWYLKSGNLTASVEEYLLWHWFGTKTIQRNHDLVTVYSDSIKAINPQNLAHFIESYIKRTDLGIVREVSAIKKSGVKNFRCPVMLIAGEHSPHLSDTVNMNGRLDPADSTWMKFECGGMVHEEAPEKLCDAYRLFLQGMGHVPNERKKSAAPVPTLSKLNLAQSRLSMASNANLLKPSNRGDAVHPKKDAACGFGTSQFVQEAVC